MQSKWQNVKGFVTQSVYMWVLGESTDLVDQDKTGAAKLEIYNFCTWSLEVTPIACIYVLDGLVAWTGPQAWLSPFSVM